MKIFNLEHIVDADYRGKIVFKDWYNKLLHDYIPDHSKNIYKLKFMVNQNLNSIDGYKCPNDKNGNGLVISKDKNLIIYNTDADIFSIPNSLELTECEQPFWGYFSEYGPLNTLIFDEIDLENTDSSELINANGLFYNCAYLENINFGRFNTSKVESMWAMFRNCDRIKDLDLKCFDTKNVKSMRCMFDQCFNLKHIDISTFDFQNVSDFSFFIRHCINLEQVDISTINLNEGCVIETSEGDISNLFYNSDKKSFSIRDEKLPDKIKECSYERDYYLNEQYNETITKILNGMTGITEYDATHLTLQINKYKWTEYGNEIAKECYRILINSMPKDKISKDAQHFDNYINGINASIEEAESLIHKRDFNKAKAILEPLVDQINQMRDAGFLCDNKVSKYIELSEPFEASIYHELIDSSKEIIDLSYHIKYATIYYRYGFILFEENKVLDARKYLKLAFDIAPCNSIIGFEYIETYRKLNEIDEFFKLTVDMFKIIYEPSMLARAYRNLGWYFAEKKQFNEAVICLVVSLKYSGEYEIDKAQSELFYITQKNKDINLKPSQEEIVKFFEDNSIPNGFHPEMVKVADTLLLSTLNTIDKKEYSEINTYLTNVTWPIVSDGARETYGKYIVVAKNESKNIENKNQYKILSIDEIGSANDIFKSNTLDIDKLNVVQFGNRKAYGIDAIIPLQWLILDKMDDKVLLLSKFIIDCKVFDNDINNKNWEKSYLRKWLNEDFYNAVFDEKEKTLIIKNEYENTEDLRFSLNNENSTIDSVTVLSVKEIEKYFKDELKSKDYFSNKLLATRALSDVIISTNIASPYSEEWYSGNSYYWTRSLSKLNNDIVCVNEDGTYSMGIESNADWIGVRPAIWVKIK